MAQMMIIDGEEVEIDDLCVPFIEFFNRNGLKTKFCCEGHSTLEDFYIQFDNSVTDEMIMEFQKKYWRALDNDYPFHKWMRICISDNCYFTSIDDYMNIISEPYSENVHDIISNWEFTIKSFMFQDGRKEYLDALYSKLISIETRK